MESTTSILIIDDDAVFGQRLAASLSMRKFQAVYRPMPIQVSSLCQGVTHAIVDLRLGEQSGLDLIEPLRQVGCSRIIVLTGYGSIATAMEAVRRGAINFLCKPASIEEILKALFGEPLMRPHDELPSDSLPTPSLHEVEWEHIQRVLADSAGNISEAAKRLGLHRQSLQRKLRKMRAARER
jgi:two-component system response regulator RegA